MNAENTRMSNLFFAVISLTLLWCIFIMGVDVYAQDTTEEEAETQEERKEREEKEKAEREAKKKKEKQEDLEEDVEELEEDLDDAQEEKKRKQAILSAQYNDLTRQRYALAQTQDEIENKDAEIARKNKDIEALEAQIALNRISLATVMRQIYYQSITSLEEKVFEASSDEGEFLLANNQNDILRQRMIDAMRGLDEKVSGVESAKVLLISAKNEKEELLTQQKEQESQLQKTTAATSQQVQEVEATIAQINGKLAGIQSELSSLLGVGLSTDDIVEAAEFASDKTGVRKGLLLGMLIVETDLGRFTGGCTYKESRMNDNRKDAFKRITKKLDYDYKKMKVSCPPSNYKGTGGAMGVAQFMSDTWESYESVIAKRTGNNPPDPWNLVDGVMAMASKLANDGATRNGKDGEWGAAARYLGSCRGNTKFYCENVLYWADNYDKKL